MRTLAALSLSFFFATTAAAQAPVEKAGFGPARTLSDVARERRAGVRGVVGGTFSVTGATGMPVLAPAPAADQGDSDVERVIALGREILDARAAGTPPAFAPVLIDVSPDWTRFFPHGYGGTRTHFGTRHSAPTYRAPSISRPPVAPPSAPAPRRSTSAITNSRRSK